MCSVSTVEDRGEGRGLRETSIESRARNSDVDASAAPTPTPTPTQSTYTSTYGLHSSARMLVHNGVLSHTQWGPCQGSVAGLERLPVLRHENVTSIARLAVKAMTEQSWPLGDDLPAFLLLLN
jgi:hypothetical protein